MLNPDPNFEHSEERDQCVYDVDPKEASIEYLAETTDEFASNLVYSLLGEEAYQDAYEKNEIRIVAVKMCSTFLSFMLERAKRQESHTATVEYLNGLL